MRKIIFFLLILVLSGPFITGYVFATGNPLVTPEAYPGKLDIKNVNGLGKNIGTDFFGGAMTFRYPLVFPTGSRGFTPDISLSYSSNNSDAFSPYGYGFSLSLPRIQRSAKKGVSELYTTDEFSAFGEDLIRENTGGNTYRSKDMSDQNLYTRVGLSWIVQTNDGKTLVFGASRTSRMSDPSIPANIYAWFLEEERDSFEHSIRYSYFLDGGQPYLSDIFYGFDRMDKNSLYTIHFEYRKKSASLTSLKSQFEVTTRNLLSRILVVVDGQGISGYELSYDTLSEPISHLTSISEFALGETPPSMTIGYGTNQYQHMITALDNGRGGEARFEYLPSTAYRSGTGELLNTGLPFVVPTLSRESFTDKITGVTREEKYTYAGGHYYFDSSDLWGREYVGFQKVVVTDEKSRTEYYFHQSQTSLKDPLKYDDNIAKKGRIYKTLKYDKSSGDILTQELYRYDMRTSILGRRLVFLVSKIFSEFENKSLAHTDKAVTYIYDEYGNTVEEKNLGFVRANLQDGTFVDVPGDSILTVNTYATNTGKNLSSFPTSTLFYGFSGELLSEKRIEYDGTSSGVLRGLTTAVTTRAVSSQSGQIRTSFSYSSGGLLVEEKNPEGYITSHTYDDRDIALTSTTNPLSWATHFLYDYRISKVISETDYNGLTEATEYDFWGRKKKITRKYNGQEYTLRTYSYEDFSFPNSTTEVIYFDLGMGDKKTTKTFTDGWGRILSIVNSTPVSGQFSVTHIRYDAFGNPVYSSYPQFIGTDIFDPTWIVGGMTTGEVYRDKIPGVSYQYDSLDRIVEQRDAKGLQKKVYTSTGEVSTNELGYITKSGFDAYGNLISLTENKDGRDITTRYIYDALGKPIFFMDTYSNIRSWIYDDFGRLREATDLHSQNDATFGVRKYRFNSLANLVEYINPKGEKVAYTYDPLGRMTLEDFGSGVTRKYLYDKGVQSLGTLESVEDIGSTVSFGYDILGRKIRETRTLGSKIYEVNYTYNTQNNLLSISYPNGGKTEYIYKNGFVAGMDYTNPMGKISHLIPTISYAPNGTILSIEYGNGVKNETMRDRNYNFRLDAQKVTSVEGVVLLDTQYKYDPIGNIKKITEGGVSPLKKMVEYEYDSLDRLTSAHYSYVHSGYNRDQEKILSYSYDDIGNIVSSSNKGDYVYSSLGYANPHAVTSIGNTVYGYDAAGHMVSRDEVGGQASFGYSLYGEMLTSSTEKIVTDYIYDHTRRRVVKSSPGLTEHHVIDGYEVEYESGTLIENPNTETSSQTLSLSSGAVQTSSSLSGDSLSSPLTVSGGLYSSGGSISQSGGTSILTGALSGMVYPDGISTGGVLIGTGGIGSDVSMYDTSSGSLVRTSSGLTDSGVYVVIAGYTVAAVSGSTDAGLITTLTHIMLGDEMVATFQTQTDDILRTPDDVQLIYHISDHLNSSSLDLSSTGIVLQATDYLPFGEKNTYEVTTKRIKGKKGGYKNKYLFANKQQDEETDLQYFEKRYYDTRIGRFTTEDPVFWEVGLTKRANNYFTLPQNWNSYSYTINNPINLVDPTGEEVDYSNLYRDKKTGDTYYKATNFSLSDGDLHYINMLQTSIEVSFNEIDTSSIRPESFRSIREKIDAGVAGVYEFKNTDAKQSFTTDTLKDCTIYGDLTYKAEGRLTIDSEGNWDFNGTLKAYDDVYDFTVTQSDWGDPRRFGRNIQTLGLRDVKYNTQGSPFDIRIRGSKVLEGKNKADPKTNEGSTVPTTKKPKTDQHA